MSLIDSIKSWFQQEQEAQSIPEDALIAQYKELYLYKPVIVISNQVENPVVGFASGIVKLSENHPPQLLVQDCLQKRDVVVLGKIYRYTEQKLDLILSMNKLDLILLIYGADYDFPLRKELKEEILSREEALACLTENGFFRAISALYP